MIGAVVPVFNRRENMDLLLSSLERQTFTGFHVVVADDGSTDGTRELVESRSRTSVWAGRLQWVWCGPNEGWRSGRARNIGTAHLQPGTRLLLTLDSDLILRPDALEGFAAVHLQHPEVAVLGGVEWLPPLDAAHVRAEVTGGRIPALRALVPRSAPTRVDGTFTGPELRPAMASADLEEERAFRPEWGLPLNSGWPLSLYWRAGGFDEAMVGYGYQDWEFGARAAAVGARCVLRPDLWALHVWHPKPATAMQENQRNLDLFLRRHGPNPIVESDIDWTLWWHYHADRGGTVACRAGETWAISADRTHRLALPDATWFARLGHRGDAPEEIGRSELLAITEHGTATE